jgi:DNA gyrase subunit A
VYDLPLLGRESRGRAVVNLLNFAEDEKIADCRNVRNFAEPGAYLIMATRGGLVKKTDLEAYSRPKRGGIIAINLREGDELVDVAIVHEGDEVVLSTANGQAIRFRQSTVRAMGRSASGVKGIKLRAGDKVVGMVVAEPDGTLLTLCAKGYGKRTPFGPNLPADAAGEEEAETDASAENEAPESEVPETAPEPEVPETEASEEGDEGEDRSGSGRRYPTKGRGGMGVRDIKTTERNGPVIGIVPVSDADELIMMSARGKIQRIAARDVPIKGRNTMGVRIMSLDEGDTLAAIVRVPPEENADNGGGEPPAESTETGS